VPIEVKPQPSSTTTCPRVRCDHSTSSSITAKVMCNTAAVGFIEVKVTASWLPRGSSNRQEEAETYKYRLELGHVCK